MFKWLRKDPIEELKRQHAKMLVEARDLQRKGDIQAFATTTAKAEEILKQIDQLESDQG